ncbi:MAG: hypothetical protein M3Z95_02410 [Actinomycetota bacterium]|nr:hypothetical protein [Actinomycetota bacterium]
MSTIDGSELLRPGLLQGVSLLLVGPRTPAQPAGDLGAAVQGACAELGARVLTCTAASETEPGGGEAAMDEAVAGAVAEAGRLELLVVDGAGLFAQQDESGARMRGAAAGGRALRACLDLTWTATRAVVKLAFLPEGNGGRIVFLAPAPDAGEHADAARAGLENLGRTLSIEWARYAITLLTLAPGTGTAPGEVAALTAYLASPAGAFFSGCLMDLRGLGAK